MKNHGNHAGTMQHLVFPLAGFSTTLHDQNKEKEEEYNRGLKGEISKVANSK